ncbi:hypothetical protein A6436_RS09280, partial [Elizabethkingia anophelis]|nr:hypothetical protein [Elizabethkingia anophelis]
RRPQRSPEAVDGRRSGIKSRQEPDAVRIRNRLVLFRYRIRKNNLGMG